MGCQAVTVLLTWGVWQTRPHPPLLPVAGLPVPQFSVGALLLATLALAVVRPAVGVTAHLVLLAYALVADQTRLQPEFVSLALLLAATTLPRLGPTLGRAHLSSLWLWSGLHKTLSLGFMSGAAQWMYQGLPVQVPALRPRFGWLVAGLEIAVGVTTLLRPTRRLGVALALLLHGMVLLVLSPFGNDWNQAVWPWNLALPLAAVVFFRPERPEHSPRLAGLAPALLTVLLFAYPAAFYLGVVDAYLSHNLYSDNTATVSCDPPGCDLAPFGESYKRFRVPLPPEPRVFRQMFEETCRPGQTLVVRPRRVRLLVGLDRAPRRYHCPAPA